MSLFHIRNKWKSAFVVYTKRMVWSLMLDICSDAVEGIFHKSSALVKSFHAVTKLNQVIFVPNVSATKNVKYFFLL